MTSRTEILYRAMAWAVEQYHDFMFNDPSASFVKNYIDQRKINSDSVSLFKIGFSPFKRSLLQDRLPGSGFSEETLVECGLISESRNGGFYDRFAGRVLFPIFDTENRAIAIGGRIVPGLVPDEEQPPGKYYNSPTTPIYSKSDNFYGLNLICDSVSGVGNRKITVVEGFTDVIAAYQGGLRNVVACQGTALNLNHINRLRIFADSITLVLDGDEAGRSRSNSAIDLFLSSDLDLNVLSLPDGLDPFGFIQDHGTGLFQELVDNAPSAIEHKIQSETNGIDLIFETYRSNQALESILRTLSQAQGIQSLKVEGAVREVAELFQVSEILVTNRLREIGRSVL